MIKWLSKAMGAGLIAAALVLSGFPAIAQTNHHPALIKKPSTTKRVSRTRRSHFGPKRHFLAFRGRVKKLDQATMSITVGKRTFYLDSKTKVFREKHPAILAEGKLGEWVTGSFRKAEHGKLIANSIYFGGKNGPRAHAKARAKKRVSPKARAEK
jgi:hypothetical protein